MLKLVWARIRRMPLISVAVTLFTAIIAMALCGLHSGNLEAQTHYNSIYNIIDVTCTVTNLAGDQSDQLAIPAGTIALFTGTIPDGPADLMDLLEDVQIKGSTQIVWNGNEYTLVGITSVRAAPNLWAENGCTIFWNGGYSESIFSENQPVCIIPQKIAEEMEWDISQTVGFPLHLGAAYDGETDYEAVLSIAGTYQGKDEKTIYCPWDTYVAILRSMGRYESADSLSATLRDNSDLPILRDAAVHWFAEPNPNAAGMDEYNGYYYALDINDSQLVQAKNNLDNSLSVNRISAILVLALSAVAGAFIGFLMIRNRKKEIALMRTMGTPNGQIYANFAMEQMIFVVLGAMVGGSKFMWNPVSWLALFVCVYFIGLSAALLVMLRKNLLTTIKEDE